MNEQLHQLLALGREFFAAGEYGKAESYLLQVLKQSKRFADVYNMLGVICHEQGQFPRAAQHFEEALKINPRYTDAALSLAVTYNEMGEYDKARRVYEQALSASHKAGTNLDPFVQGKIANMYSEIGDVWQAHGRGEQARAEYERALEMCPNFHDIRTKLALSLRDDGNLEGCATLLEQVVDESAGFLRARVELGLTYYSLGRKDDAVAQWEEVLKRDFANKSARMYLRLVQADAMPGKS